MKTFIVFSMLAFVASLFITPHAQAGAAICIAKQKTPKNNQTDVQYFTRWSSNVNGYKAEKAARDDYKEEYSGTPSCRNTGNLMNGYFVVIKNVRKNYAGERRVTYAFGYGESRGEAEQDAVDELGRRNWSWKKSEGYAIEDVQEF